jgi:DNA-binding NarL/FixJ family response regulator
MDKVDLIIADSNQLIRFGLRSIFKSLSNYNIVAEVANETELRECLQSFNTDVILVDFAAPGFSIDCILQVRKLHPHTQFAAITEEQTALTIVSALKAGIVSYIKKDCDIQEIISAVGETAKGGRFFCGQILETLRKEDIDPEDEDIKAFTCEPVHLSDRELEVITMIAEGYTNNQIAEKLFLSNHTVNTHRKNIMAKLGVNNTASIVMYAVKTNLVCPNRFLFAPSSN